MVTKICKKILKAAHLLNFAMMRMLKTDLQKPLIQMKKLETVGVQSLTEVNAP